MEPPVANLRTQAWAAPTYLASAIEVYPKLGATSLLRAFLNLQVEHFSCLSAPNCAKYFRLGVAPMVVAMAA